jgi:hypothetical protein
MIFSNKEKPSGLSTGGCGTGRGGAIRPADEGSIDRHREGIAAQWEKMTNHFFLNNYKYYIYDIQTLWHGRCYETSRMRGVCQ